MDRLKMNSFEICNVIPLRLTKWMNHSSNYNRLNYYYLSLWLYHNCLKILIYQVEYTIICWSNATNKWTHFTYKYLIVAYFISLKSDLKHLFSVSVYETLEQIQFLRPLNSHSIEKMIIVLFDLVDYQN